MEDRPRETTRLLAGTTEVSSDAWARIVDRIDAPPRPWRRQRLVLAAEGLLGVEGIAPPDVATVRAFLPDGRSVVTETVDGGSRFPVRFFAFPDLDVSNRPTGFAAYDAGGRQLERIG